GCGGARDRHIDARPRGGRAAGARAPGLRAAGRPAARRAWRGWVVTVAVAILMKDPAEAKTRPRPVLGADARESLALLMFENTLAYFTRAGVAAPGRPWPVGVVTASPRIAALASASGAEAIAEPAGGGINAAASAAAAWARGIEAASLLV